MKYIALIISASIIVGSCSYEPIKVEKSPDVRILFLHHSTGNTVWQGEKKTVAFLSERHNQPAVPWLISEYNRKSGKKYAIDEKEFPKDAPYGWKNYPYDYYTIWVKHAGYSPYMEEPTLEILTKEYDVVVFKHCFPVSSIQEDDTIASADSETKTLANYKLQYDSLKIKLRSFPQTKFIIWTGAALVKAKTNEAQAQRAKEFSSWIKEVWDEPGDNIYIWDFRQLETEGGLYLTNGNARSKKDSHPGEKFCEKAANLFVSRIISVIEKNGEDTNLSGVREL